MTIQDFSPSPDKEIQFLLLRRIDVTFELDAITHVLRVKGNSREEERLKYDHEVLKTKRLRIQDRIEELIDVINRKPEVPYITPFFHSGDLVASSHELRGYSKHIEATYFVDEGTRFIVLGESGQPLAPLVVALENNPTWIISVSPSDLVKVNPDSDAQPE